MRNEFDRQSVIQKRINFMLKLICTTLMSSKREEHMSVVFWTVDDGGLATDAKLGIVK